jgi:type IV pilus assembly protein PilZ
VSDPLSPSLDLRLVLKDKAALYSAYMSYTAKGGLFVPTVNISAYKLGDSFTLTLSLLEEVEPYILNVTVIWITPKGAQGHRVSGVGVQFDEKDPSGIRNTIENYLAGGLQSDKATHTM